MSHEEIYLNNGDAFPYDIENNNPAPDPKAKDWAVRAARGVIANLCDRRGIKHGFYDVDHEVRVEIVETLAKIIRLANEQGIKREWEETEHLNKEAAENITVEQANNTLKEYGFDPDQIGHKTKALVRVIYENHQLQKMLVACEAQRDLAQKELDMLRESKAALAQDYQNTCVLVAEMHAAAVGEVTSPKRGVVEDIADLRALAIKQEEQLNRILQPGERLLELKAASRRAKDEYRINEWLEEYADKMDLAQARLLEAIADTLKEMVKK